MVDVEVRSKPSVDINIVNSKGVLISLAGKYIGREVEAEEESKQNVQILTTSSVDAETNENVLSSLRSRRDLLSKKEDDIAEGNYTFNKDVAIQGNLSIGGVSTHNGVTYFKDNVTFGNFLEQGGIIQGARITKEGYGMFAALKSPTMQIYELLYNRKTSVQGEFIFSDGDTVDAVAYVQADGTEIDYKDYDGEEYQYIRLTLREQYEGYTTTFKADDILYANINNIGVSGSAAKTGKCFMRCNKVGTDGLTLNVIMYSDSQCPGGVNTAPTEYMTITRHGNETDTSRQNVFIISSETGALIQLMGVDSPIIDDVSVYGTVLGLLPDAVKEYLNEKGVYNINENQPYLYARGAIVQDLIIVDYKGRIIKSANFRGAWSEETAANDPYLTTDTMYDTVTHNGSLWACQQSNTTVEPNEYVGEWLLLVAKGDSDSAYIYGLKPSANIVYVRDGGVLSVSTLDVVIGVTATSGYFEIADQADLTERGLAVYYAIDGEGEKTLLNISPAEPIELEDGTETLELESGTGSIYLEGDEIDVENIKDNITLYLMKEDGTEVASYVIPVIKDGASPYMLEISPVAVAIPVDATSLATAGERSNTVEITVKQGTEVQSISEYTYTVEPYYLPAGYGVNVEVDEENSKYVMTIDTRSGIEQADRLDSIIFTLMHNEAVVATGTIQFIYVERGMKGDTGALPYMAGEWTLEAAKAGTYPVATDITPIVLYQNDYFARTAEPYPTDTSNAPIYNDPATSVDTDGCWKKFQKFELIFTNVLMASYARLAASVFEGNYQFSQYGLTPTGDYGQYDSYIESGIFDSNGKLTGNFVPNFFVNFLTGEAKTACLSEPFAQIPTSTNIYQIDPSIAHNVSIQYNREYPIAVFLPRSENVTDGANCTVVFQSRAMVGLVKEVSTEESWDSSLGEKLAIICADGRIPTMTEDYAEGERDAEGLFMVNGLPARFLLIAPGDVVKMRSVNIPVYDGSDIESYRRVWVVENQDIFSPIYASYTIFSDSTTSFEITSDYTENYPQSTNPMTFASKQIYLNYPNNNTYLKYQLGLYDNSITAI